MSYGELRDQVRGLALLSAKQAPMANLETGASTSNTSRSEHQVFLSFREPDTRRTFVDILYQALVDTGIRVFINDEGLQPGERISGNLLQAINNSKLYIPIFSKDYASSHWCLDELVTMVENKGKVIFPIFYDVKPNDVKLKTALYKDAISNLEQKMEDQKNKFSSKDIEKWQQALREVGDIKGWELEKYSGPGELIQVLVCEVMARLTTRKRRLNRDVVGMEDKIETIKKLLDIDSGGVQLIGIYGMGGIGKTTLAKIIFNELCPRFGRNCSFLDDVRETIKSKGLVMLQAKLLSDISKSTKACEIHDVDHGINMIGEIIYNRKMLIVLDDVDEANQIIGLIGMKSLYPGTRILVTTRDKSVLNIRGFKYKFMHYEMVLLSDKDALKLFSRHAFNDDSPPNDYYTLSMHIVSIAEGLPLALQSIGSSLFKRKREVWGQWLEKLQKTIHKDVLAKLKISYDALELHEQQIFLDIACFFVGENKTNPMYLWKDCGFDPDSAIEVLTNMCMIKVLDNDRFWMHDHFIDLGRAIAKAEHTMLYDRDDTIRALRSTEIKQRVQAIRLASSWDWGQPPITVTSEQIKWFPHLRFLSFYQVICQGDFTGCLSKLKWISLNYPYIFPAYADLNQRLEATNLLHLENAVVVNLVGLDITEAVFECLIKGARKLKVLTIQYNRSIHGTPTFPGHSVLEKLTISRFLSLMEIDCSIGKLRRLTNLTFESCQKLIKLPEQIGELQNLQHLSLKNCRDLIELPDSILKLNSLTKLDVSGTKITRLPDSIGELPYLSSVDASCTLIAEMPSTMSDLRQLQTLDLDCCHRIRELPELSTSLTTLRLRSTSLQTIPNLSYLTNLLELVLSDDSDLGAKSNIIQTCDLQWIGGLSNLSKLRFCFANVRAPTIELGSLSLLEELTLYGLDLPTFKQLPSNLIVLELYNSQGKRVHLEELPSLKRETKSVSTSLTKSRENKVLKHLEHQFLHEIELLERSPFSDWNSSERLVCLSEESRCNELQAPELIDHWRGAFHFPSSQKRLKRFHLSGFPEVRDIQFVSMWESLEVFSVAECSSLKSLGGLSNLKYLKDLSIIGCKSLKVVEGIDELECLYELEIDGCLSMERIFDASSSKIPNACQILITCSGELPDCGQTYVTWESYRERIFHGTKQASGSKIETTGSEIERGDPLRKKSMEKMRDEARQQAEDTEISERNYPIAAIQAVVGIDDGVQQITDLLEMEVNDEVCIIGIYGTDGIGKTTLAKAVYNRISSCFDSCSFLGEVEATLQNSSDIQFFQTKLIRDILERDREDPSFDERIEDFLDIFREMKVLIVIDDVEKQSYLHAIVGDLHWFGLGSRIIVTSQNEEILKEYDPEKARTYMVGKLDDNQAFELFCQHAFGKKSPTPGYDGHVNCIVNATEKLPLAIEVTGSFLRGKSIGEWEKMEESIKKFMSSSGKTTVCFAEISDMCYKGLDPKQKHIFLDIACFISGVDARVASYMWSTSYPPFPDCILMPLAKIGENNELQMHSLLRCVGRRILDQKGSEDPIQRKSGMALKAKSSVKGKENIEARRIDLDDHDSCKFTAEDFESIPDKTFLKLDNAKVFGDYTGAFPSLKWLCWQSCPSDFSEENFVLRELVILDLSGSKVTEDWRGWSQIKMEKLKVLNLMGCSDILITPNFSGYKDLEILILERCSRLVKLDPSIGHLKRLVSLNLKSCSQLNKLPVELGHMTALEELFIDGTSVRKIPISIGNLKKLKFLSGLKCFQLSHLPSSVSCLIALSVLSLDGTKISELPSSLGELLSLRRLSLRDCHYMQELPDSIGKVGSSLEELDISATSISTLPNSIKNLQNLRVLRMDSSFVRAFPAEIGNLTKLEELHASWCRSLQGGIPRDIKRLYHLRSLTLGHSSISSLPSEISTISSLHTLDLLQCNEIEVLPKLPPSLICLRVSSKRMKAIPLLKDLKELEELYLSDEDPQESRPPSKQLMPESKVKQLSIWFSRLWNLELLQTHWTEQQSFSISFPKLRKLELSLSRIIKLHIVYEPTDIPQLKTLTLSGMSLEQVSELPKTLSVLSIRGCSSLTRLRIVQSLTNISAFELYHSAIEEIEGLEGLKSLKRLDLSNCKIQNLNGIVQLTSLRSLIVSNCDYLHSLPDLSNLKLLKVLEIRQCKMIRQIEGLEELTSLEKLKISECPAENSVQVQNVLKLVKARSLVT